MYLKGWARIHPALAPQPATSIVLKFKSQIQRNFGQNMMWAALLREREKEIESPRPRKTLRGSGQGRVHKDENAGWSTEWRSMEQHIMLQHNKSYTPIKEYHFISNHRWKNKVYASFFLISYKHCMILGFLLPGSVDATQQLSTMAL
jgi:hypothetical protein